MPGRRGDEAREIQAIEDGISLQEAVAQHLSDHGFPSDGGIDDKWVSVGVGPIPLCFPNTKARRKAAPIHDLNHVLSGYEHDAIGEAEIGAWELGGGCRTCWAAWVLDWAALVPGVVVAPRRMLRAFARGRRTGNLYGTDTDAVRREPVRKIREAMGLDRHHPIGAGDVLLFAGVTGLAPIVALIPLTAAIVTSPAWLAAGAHKGRRAMTRG